MYRLLINFLQAVYCVKTAKCSIIFIYENTIASRLLDIQEATLCKPQAQRAKKVQQTSTENVEKVMTEWSLF